MSFDEQNIDMTLSKSLEELCEIAVKLGAAEAKVINASDVVVRDWVRLKCQYGCDGYGKCLTCPPYSPNPEQMRRILSGYSSAMLLRFEPEWENVHKVVARLEREAFLSGYYSAFGLASGPCFFEERKDSRSRLCIFHEHRLIDERSEPYSPCYMT